MKRLLCILAAGTMLLTLGACKDTESDSNKTDSGNITAQLAKPEKGEDIAVITTDFGEIKMKFFPKVAPKGVENFTTHVKNGYYNNLTFHRIVKDFVIQGGDPQGTGRGGESIWGGKFNDEIDMTALHHFRGAVAYANSGKNSNGSQFYIVQPNTLSTGLDTQMKNAGWDQAVIDAYKQYGGTPSLDGGYTIFGQVYEGMDVVDKIASVEIADAQNGTPKDKVIIKKIEMKKYEG